MKARYPTADTETSILLQTRQPCADDEQEIIAGRLQMARTNLVEIIRTHPNFEEWRGEARRRGRNRGMSEPRQKAVSI